MLHLRATVPSDLVDRVIARPTDDPAVTGLAALAACGLGWITVEDITGPRPGTAFIYTPDEWSFIAAVIAAAAGVLSLTSARVGGLSLCVQHASWQRMAARGERRLRPAPGPTGDRG